ncbi:MAG: tRNA-t(6)A37 methylthiotransferase [uncultured Thiotrichaceae bacterium]|uniref:tRNA-t(6)A37 methylthiotransferase n=1 Tax=uncultured Thiotrichaceae bacterium TaxID=298394 RepID=A0A6S6TPE9_9GAMM|nr:MAG: tRNA-t(6)A37 methylthiotransferase [uncultured Thiotrichaceae bacterium]
MNIHLKALGCRLNEAELEQWSQTFRSNGHQIVQSSPDADVVVLNTCAVTNEASAKSRRLMNRLYRDNPAAKLVVSGCYATLQADEVADNLGVDLVVPNDRKDQLPEQVMKAFELPIMPKIMTEPGESGLFIRGRHRAFIKIQDGCRYRCTFCIVTVARGEERSRQETEIIDEINQLSQQGIQEIVLTGVHVGGYGSDLDNSTLYSLVQRVLAETDIPRIRFASVEPWDLPDNFFALFSDSRLMPHMHLPIQSGADSVLRRMARRCKTGEFTTLLEQARRDVPGFNVTTDIIVGFPGETEEEWAETLAYVEQTGFGHIHIFTYSEREGTKAARLENRVAEPVRKQRSQTLHQLAEQLKQNWLRQQLGQSVNVLWERRREEGGQAFYSGYTPNYCKVIAQTDTVPALVNKITPVYLGALDDGSAILQGEFV